MNKTTIEELQTKGNELLIVRVVTDISYKDISSNSLIPFAKPQEKINYSTEDIFGEPDIIINAIDKSAFETIINFFSGQLHFFRYYNYQPC